MLPAPAGTVKPGEPGGCGRLAAAAAPAL